MSRITKKEADAFVLPILDFLGVATHRKPITIIMDYKTDEGYKNQRIYASAPASMNDKDILEQLPQILELLGETGKCEIGMLCVADGHVNININGEDSIKTNFGKFRILHFDINY